MASGYLDRPAQFEQTTSARIVSLRGALAEVLAARRQFSEEAYNEIVHALNEKIDALEALDDTPVVVGSADEIRLVTVMFVDVANSTQLAQRLDEDWKALIGDVHQRIARVVEEWDGEIGQYLGDGVLCFFGAHRSRDDDAVRAVSCALAIQQMAETYAPSINVRYNQSFALRIGISTGRVVVGVIGTAAKSEFVAMGPTTNLAARLQQLCAPNQVLIDEQTYHVIHDHFHVQAQPPATLKGFDTPVEYYEVTGRRQPTTLLTGDSVAGISLPFVGRERELRYLLRLWDDALAEGQLHVVTIYGDTGVGKSRLLQEALAQAAIREFHPVTLVARHEQRGASYILLRQLLVDLCHLTETMNSVAAEAQILQTMRALMPEKAEAAALAIGRMAGFAFAGSPSYNGDSLALAAEWFAALAGERALLLTVDNLQWVDAASLDLLEYLAMALLDRGGVIVGAARSEFRRLRPNYMNTSARATEIALGRLSDDATRRMIESVLEYVDNAPALLVSHIGERAEGNPLFVEEFLRMLFDSGVFEPSANGRWHANLYLYGTLASTLPNGLIGVFQARLDDLSPMARRVLQIASVIGQTCWGEAVSLLSGFDASVILSDLAARGMLVRNAESSLERQTEYRFRHTLYREVAYSMLTRSDREAYHRKTAEWLGRFVNERPDYLGALAEHLVQGQQREQALAVFLVAAKDRMRRGLPGETLKLVESGLASARDVPREIALPLVSQLWLWQGQALSALRRYDEASAAGQTALMLMQELPAGDLLAERTLAAQVLKDAREHLERTR